MRRWATAALAVLLVLLAIAAAGRPVFVDPQVDEPRKADAILVVGGDAPVPRVRRGFELAEQGWAPTLVLSNPGGQVDDWCDAARPGFTVECFAPDPHTTLGEARELGRLASERHWQTVIVVTYAPHISRARYIMTQCFDGALVMVEVPTRLSVFDWAWMYVYQGAGYAKAFLQGGC